VGTVEVSVAVVAEAEDTAGAAVDTAVDEVDMHRGEVPLQRLRRRSLRALVGRLASKKGGTLVSVRRTCIFQGMNDIGSKNEVTTMKMKESFLE